MEYVKFAKERRKRDFKLMGKEAAIVDEVLAQSGRKQTLCTKRGRPCLTVKNSPAQGSGL